MRRAVSAKPCRSLQLQLAATYVSAAKGRMKRSETASSTNLEVLQPPPSLVPPLKGMDSGGSPQGRSIYFWFSLQPDKRPLSLCTQGVEGGELTGAYPSMLVRPRTSQMDLGFSRLPS